MYQQHWKLAEMPYEMGPDPRYLQMTDQHKDAFYKTLLAIQERRGLTVVHGEIGMGKSTIARRLYETLKSRDGFSAGLINNPSLYSETAFLKAIMGEFKIKTPRSKADSFTALQVALAQAHAQNETRVIIVDEAQTLRLEHFRVIHTLLNFESNTHKFLQIVLVGQNELAERLDTLPHLHSRVAIFTELVPLSEPDTHDLVNFRWHTASAGKSSAPFDEDALETIYIVSGGLPRMIIKLCHLSLLLAFSRGLRDVTKDIVMEAAKEVRVQGGKGVKQHV